MRAVVLALLILFGAASVAAADEKIAEFVSDATINADASLTVRETIVYEFRDIGPKRGIFRDVPTRYRDPRGFDVVVGFDVLSVARDGREEPHAIEAIANGRRIRIGQADVFLDEGPQRYEIVYRTTRQLGFFEDIDELYWNVTGNLWPFTIDKARVIVRLPPGARIVRHAAYTGYQDAQGEDFRVVSAAGDRYEAETTRPLFPGQGFTVAVGFTKGVVSAPTGSDKLGWFVSDNGGLIAMLGGILLAGLYYLVAWTRVGRDPPGGTVVPLFAPPPALGPAGARYVWRQSFDDKAFAAAMVDLAVKKRARIHDDDGDFAVEKLNGPGPALTGAEAQLHAAMRPGRQELKQSNHATVRAMRGALQGALAREFDGVAFLRNLGWFWGGMILSVAALAAAALLFLPTEDAMTGLFMTVWAGGWWAAVLAGLAAALRGFSRSGIAAKFGSLVALLFLVPFVGAGIAAPTLLLAGAGTPGLYALAATTVVLGAMNLLFYRLLRAPTVAGRKLLDRIEGFRMYLATAEEERLNTLHPPEKTPELFERYLPHALALDCENEWGEKFKAVLALAAVAAPAWYAGNRWNSGDVGGFTRSLGSSLAGATAASHSPPGSSSGSSGGGSSGGGGGGGGGGSW